jgi:hypothetical protein
VRSLKPIAALLVTALVAASVTRPALAAPPTSVRNVYDLLQLVYELPVPPACSKTTASVGASATRILTNDPTSISVAIINDSANTCYLAYDGSVSATNGVVLSSGGGNVTEDFRADLVLQTYEHWAYCTGASSALTIVRCDLQ